ncbi:MAG TPA: hypothetical protein VK762_12245 [Polyangiaceae bacterium]|jgi:hypothetical protein|nr:hypothetical protein [Polyangiaceae bacterium]
MNPSTDNASTHAFGRSSAAGLLLSAFLVLAGAAIGCGNSSASTQPDGGGGAAIDGNVESDAAVPDGCAVESFDAGAYAKNSDEASIGAPCLPLRESNPSFDGFLSAETGLDPAPSGTATCLIYHFEGLVTCPYGQNAAGQAPACAAPCTTSTGQPVSGKVTPQCSARPASQTVVWSCRCANAQGMTNDGDDYCTCPSDTTCTQVIPSIGAAEDDVSGAYCLAPAVVVAPGTNVTCGAACDPVTQSCR